MNWTPLLLWQLIITIAMSTNKQNQQFPGPRSCSDDEYMDVGLCCKKCPAGYYVEEPCRRPHTQGKCVPCDQGTFTAFSNGLNSCLLCDTCHDDQEMVGECSQTRNRKCQCKAGYFYQYPESSESCMPCDKCPEGIPVLWECNATSNIACGVADPKNSNRLYWIGYIMISICVILFICGLLCKRLNLIRSRGRPVAGNANESENTVRSLRV
ncbi:tumor necrosis factor receptor superfamily member 23-like isoform X2 [Fukomys damarensis]|uniref:tumor necrosis factor receptor superfamily member 23-like isoform X2 n=1 Tax=Fukomys damarensis TaxID=885580 RepID=UPI00053F3B8B|nr:tumor necrosis factor receptor superfamily member 23-like isoform X2 [Fukomys damarensis]